MQESKNHHFVPKLLLRPWLTENAKKENILRGYWWDARRNELACKSRGLDSFCFQIGLLTLKTYPLGRDAIEAVFFGEIDDKGAISRDKLCEGGPKNLNSEQRCDFARLLLSLEARRPQIVDRLKKEGQAYRACQESCVRDHNGAHFWA